MIDFDPSIGEEQRKVRPAVVVSDDFVGRLKLRIVVPITTWDQKYATHAWLVRIKNNPANGLEKESGADAFQVKSLSLDRFKRRIGRLTEVQMESIATAIALCVGYTS